ncbi:hypothetical protein C5D09_06895 [Rathayibacter sp. AY1C9]|jgi:hypothetical protein|nr:hypothetical protein C5C71_15200 [Rathayibacter sp. AY1C1]PPH46672.1 hypothetical protein C5D09_06895 [Rathayibacter sp. AY1C9]
MRVLHYTTYPDTHTFVRVDEVGRVMTVAHTEARAQPVALPGDFLVGFSVDLLDPIRVSVADFLGGADVAGLCVHFANEESPRVSPSAKVKPSDPLRCVSCAAVTWPSAERCEECGTRQPDWDCAFCGHAMPPTLLNCADCGYRRPDL